MHDVNGRDCSEQAFALCSWLCTGATPLLFQTICDCSLLPTQVLMHCDRPCKMGISFWPTMAFKASRPPQVCMDADAALHAHGACMVCMQHGKCLRLHGYAWEAVVTAARLRANTQLHVQADTQLHVAPPHAAGLHCDHLQCRFRFPNFDGPPALTPSSMQVQPAAARLLLPDDPWLTAAAAPSPATAAAKGDAAAKAAAAESAAPANGAGGAIGAGDAVKQQQEGEEAGAAATSVPAAAEVAAVVTMTNGTAKPLTSSTSTLSGREAAAAAVAAGRRLLLVDFTKDPPDEFQVGAKFMCGLPFPFISIRTTRLAVSCSGWETLVIIIIMVTLCHSITLASV